MSKLKTLSAVVAIAATASFFNFTRTGEEIVAKSFPPEQEVLEGRKPATLTEETFWFKKSAHVNFTFSDEVVEQSFEGHLFLDWQKKDSEKVARVSLRLPKQETDLFLEAYFSEDHELRCVKAPENVTELESDYLVLMKSLLLDYAFRTNQDDNGEYLATLKTIDASRDQQKITKIKTAYTGQVSQHLLVESSLHEIMLEHSLKEAKGEEKFKLLFPDKAGGGFKEALTRTRYQLKEETKTISRPVVELKRKLTECSSDFSQQVKIVEKTMDREFQEVIFELAGADRSRRQELMRKILKGLRSNPALLVGFMDWVNSVLTDRKLSAFAIGILGTLGTPEAQKELVGLFSGATEETKHLQYQVLNAFTLADAGFTSDTREFLKLQIAESSRLSAGAAYALGSAIHNDPEGSQREVDYLLNGLSESRNRDSTLMYLDAIGNSGAEKALPALTKYAASADEEVREKAILGLRFIENQSNENIFRSALNDPSPRVREAVLEAIRSSDRPQLYAHVLSECEQGSINPELRKECGRIRENF